MEGCFTDITSNDGDTPSQDRNTSRNKGDNWGIIAGLASSNMCWWVVSVADKVLILTHNRVGWPTSSRCIFLQAKCSPNRQKTIAESIQWQLWPHVVLLIDGGALQPTTNGVFWSRWYQCKIWYVLFSAGGSRQQQAAAVSRSSTTSTRCRGDDADNPNWDLQKRTFASHSNSNFLLLFCYHWTWINQ